MLEQAQKWQALLEINNALITHRSGNDLFREVCAALRRVMPCDSAGLGIYDPTIDDLRIIALEGELPPDTKLKVGAAIDRQGNEEGRKWDLKPVLREDLDETCVYTFEHRVRDAGYRAGVTVPLLLRGEIVGAVGIASREPNRYCENDLEFMQEAAKQIALAMANMRAYEELSRANQCVAREAERRQTLLDVNNAVISNLRRQDLVRAVSRAVARAVPFDVFGLSIYDPNSDELRVEALEGEFRSGIIKLGSVMERQKSPSWSVFESQTAVIRPDLQREHQSPRELELLQEGIYSLCYVPLVYRGSSIGVLGLASRTKGCYTQEHLELVQEVANQIALAIANSQAYEQIAALKSQLQTENAYLQEEIRSEHNFEEVIGNSPALVATLDRVAQVASTDSTVLILGETGTGKELIARAIHDRSSRGKRALVKVNCGAITEGLVESELFGHVRGAFTGALMDREGRFKIADGGTIFLDEVGELPLGTQVKLLRVLQEREFEPLGTHRTLRVDVRIIAATNRNLQSLVEEGEFRSDLFFRLNVFPLRMPALRERREDIPVLAAFFLQQCARRMGRNFEGISARAMQQMLAYDWPGNVRELQNVIERAVILSHGRLLELDQQLRSDDRKRATSLTSEPEPASMEAVARQHIVDVLEQTGWVIEGPHGAAPILKVHPNTLRARMKKLGIQRPPKFGTIRNVNGYRTNTLGK